MGRFRQRPFRRISFTMAIAFDPQTLAVLGVDSHLPLVPAEALLANALRRRFLTPPVWAPETHPDVRLTDRQAVQASVLIALVPPFDRGRVNRSGAVPDNVGEIGVLLTQRTEHLTVHAGQISFPGGRAEPEDADATATALRETFEEIGLVSAQIEVLGAMPTLATGTGFIITPIVALVRPSFELRIEPNEVAEVFEAPLSFLMNPANHRRHAVDLANGRREFLSIPWDGVDANGQPRRYFIWGATAAMLRDLYRFLVA